jgi:hypothetical protein
MLTALTAMACSATTVIDGSPATDDDGTTEAGGANGTGGDGGEGGAAPSCAIDAPGPTFDFLVTNIGNRDLLLTYGCGSDLPIELDTAEGPLGIGAGNADFCQVSCDQVYEGSPNNGCSDCGPGYGDVVGPGETVTIAWDRRVYVEHTAPEACSGLANGNQCALGKTVDGKLSGTLTFCTDPLANPGGYCYTGDEEQVGFTVDTDGSEMTIEIQ